MEEKKKKSPVILIVAVVLILAGVVGTYYFYTKYNELKNDPTIVATEELETITSKVGELMELPTDETPSLATVEDKDALANQEFFNTSENGDKLLIYTNAKLAILYRPSTKKIIKVAPLYIDENIIEKETTESDVERDTSLEEE